MENRLLGEELFLLCQRYNINPVNEQGKIDIADILKEAHSKGFVLDDIKLKEMIGA